MEGPLLPVFPALKRAARGEPALSQRICGVARRGVIGNLRGSGQISSWMVANPDRHPFWGNFRVGGHSPETPKFVALALDSSLGDCVNSTAFPTA